MSGDEQSHPITGRFLRGRLRHAMTDEDKARLEDLIEEDEVCSGPHTILERGEHAEHSTLLVDGFALRTIEKDDRTFIVGLHVPGDFVDLHAFALKRLDHSILTIGRAHLAYVSHDRLAGVMRNDPRLARILWFASLLDAAIHRTWIMKLEQLRADCLLAHMFAEIWYRLEMVGLARPNGFVTALTQGHLAGMCGISEVHVSRALRVLKTQNIAQFRRGRMFADDRAALEAHGRFSPDYLYGKGVLQMQRTDRL